MNLELDKKRILVTGGSRGIGKAIANAFLVEGANVCITARNVEQLKSVQDNLAKLYGVDRIIAEQADATIPVDISSLYEKVMNFWSGLDVLILNVGDGSGSRDALPEQDIWDNGWNKNFNSARYTAEMFLPMLKRSNGCILFVSSIAGLEMIGAPTQYSVAKSALLALSKNMASKLGRDVRVNVVAPGNVLCNGGVWHKKLEADPMAVEEMLQSKVPLKRLGQPEEIADAVTFLCSDRASFITGSVLVVDGGQTTQLT